MSADYDPSEFIDGDYLAHKAPAGTPGLSGQTLRAPTREEVDSKVADAQQKLAELKRAQEELERERTALEETRRRQIEFQTGREETLSNVTRGIALLEEAEFSARREAEQMAKALAELREAVGKIQAVREETWTQDNFNVELTRALTTLENARMEYNSARLKFEVLSGESAQAKASTEPAATVPPSSLAGMHFGELCRVGLALTWPVAAAVLMVLAALLALVVRH